MLQSLSLSIIIAANVFAFVVEDDFFDDCVEFILVVALGVTQAVVDDLDEVELATAFVERFVVELGRDVVLLFG